MAVELGTAWLRHHPRCCLKGACWARGLVMVLVQWEGWVVGLVTSLLDQVLGRFLG